jgi:hypothetical protein
MKCPGLHCDGCGDGGSGPTAGAAAVIFIAVAIAIERKPIGHAISQVTRVIIDLAEITGAVIGSAVVIVLAVSVGRRLARTHARASLPSSPAPRLSRTAPRLSRTAPRPLSGRVLPRELPAASPAESPARQPWESPADYWQRL